MTQLQTYEWCRRIILSCKNQGQCNTAERLLWLCKLDHEYFVELRELLYDIEISFVDEPEASAIKIAKEIRIGTSRVFNEIKERRALYV